MARKHFRLTPLIRSRILAGIRSGGYAHVAAQAWGIGQEVFEDWLKRGQGPKAREPYASFAVEVAEARAQARLKAEIAVFQHDPKIWLEHGPGREMAGNPGWSVAVKPSEHAPEGRNVLLDPDLMQLFRFLLEILTPFPEARIKVAEALWQLDGRLHPRTSSETQPETYHENTKE